MSSPASTASRPSTPRVRWTTSRTSWPAGYRPCSRPDRRSAPVPGPTSRSDRRSTVTPAPAPSSGPVPKRVAERVSRGFRKWAGRFRDAAERARDEHDAEAIHDLRVAIRRLSEMLWLWKPLLRASGAGSLRRRLRRLRRDLGPVREVEVHLALVRRLRFATGGSAKAASATLIEHLEPRRRRARRAAAAQ